MRTKVVSNFIFSQSFQTKKIKALRPEMTKIASRGGGGSCLKKQWKNGGKTCCCASLSKNFSSFLDDWKCVGSVLKNSDAKYNVEKGFQLNLPVVRARTCVVAESSPTQKPKSVNDKYKFGDSFFGGDRANQSRTN